MNKITFFRFSNSKHRFDVDLKTNEEDNKNNFEYSLQYLKNHPNKFYRKLNKEENYTINRYDEIKKEFKSKLTYDEKQKLDINNVEKRLLNPELNNNLIKERLHIKISSEFNLYELYELISQKTYNYHHKNYERNKEKINLLKLHERIEIEDINELNDLISKMNEKGWSIKQIEGIQSGVYDVSYREHGAGGAGFGYSFTEGVMIVWKK